MLTCKIALSVFMMVATGPLFAEISDVKIEPWASKEIDIAGLEGNQSLAVLHQAMEFLVRQAVPFGISDFKVREFADGITLNPLDKWRGIGHMDIVIEHGDCTRLKRLAADALYETGAIMHAKGPGDVLSKLAAGASKAKDTVVCLRNAEITCTMAWKNPGPDHHILKLEKCIMGGNVESKKMVVESVPKSDTRVELVRVH